jgi:hypothetical protein
MKRLIALGVLLIVGIELLALLVHDRRLVLAASGVALALVLLSVHRLLTHPAAPDAEPVSDDLGDSLRRWLSATETTIRWSDSIATGQRQAKDPATFDSTGQMLFGTELWKWVDPNNVTRTGSREPGPGRGALEEILQKLEQV